MHSRLDTPADESQFVERAAALIASANHLELKALLHVTLSAYELRMQLGVLPFTPTVEAVRSGQLRLELLPLVRDISAEENLVEALKRVAA